MNETSQGRGDRREFLRGGARSAVLTGLAVVSAVLFQRSRGKLTGQTCTNEGICSGCGVYPTCGLPPALSRKQFNAGSNRREEAQTSSRETQSVLASAATRREEET